MQPRKLLYIAVMIIGFAWTTIYIADLHQTIHHKNKVIEQKDKIIESLTK
jgi:uncharacterized protein YoxC